LFAPDDWIPELGPFEDFYMARACDEKVLSIAQHGGTVTAPFVPISTETYYFLPKNYCNGTSRAQMKSRKMLQPIETSRTYKIKSEWFLPLAENGLGNYLRHWFYWPPGQDSVTTVETFCFPLRYLPFAFLLPPT